MAPQWDVGSSSAWVSGGCNVVLESQQEVRLEEVEAHNSLGDFLVINRDEKMPSSSVCLL